MKRAILILSLLSASLLALSSCEKADGPIDLSGCQVTTTDEVIPYVGDEYMSQNTDIRISKNPYRSKSTISSLEPNIKSPSGINWLIYIDLNPCAKWSHDCLYRFVNAKNGKITDIIGHTMPDNIGENFTQIKSYVWGSPE